MSTDFFYEEIKKLYYDPGLQEHWKVAKLHVYGCMYLQKVFRKPNENRFKNFILLEKSDLHNNEWQMIKSFISLGTSWIQEEDIFSVHCASIDFQIYLKDEKK